MPKVQVTINVTQYPNPQHLTPEQQEVSRKERPTWFQNKKDEGWNMDDEWLYRVNTVTNAITPVVAEIITPAQVTALIDDGVKVNIK